MWGRQRLRFFLPPKNVWKRKYTRRWLPKDYLLWTFCTNQGLSAVVWGSRFPQLSSARLNPVSNGKPGLALSLPNPEWGGLANVSWWGVKSVRVFEMEGGPWWLWCQRLSPTPRSTGPQSLWCSGWATSARFGGGKGSGEVWFFPPKHHVTDDAWGLIWWCWTANWKHTDVGGRGPGNLDPGWFFHVDPLNIIVFIHLSECIWTFKTVVALSHTSKKRTRKRETESGKI